MWATENKRSRFHPDAGALAFYGFEELADDQIRAFLPIEFVWAGRRHQNRAETPLLNASMSSPAAATPAPMTGSA